MPGITHADDFTRQFTDLEDEVRRLRRASAASLQALGEYDEFTLASSSDSTHTLTYLPATSMIPLAALNGLAGRYGTDYTVNFSTGVVTWSATKTTGDILCVFYQTNGQLKVRSSTPDTGATGTSTNWRILSNTATLSASYGGGAIAFAYTDTRATGNDITATLNHNDAGEIDLCAAYKPHAPGGTGWRCGAQIAGGAVRAIYTPASGTGDVYNSTIVTVTFPCTLRATYDSATGTINVYYNGASTPTATIIVPGGDRVSFDTETNVAIGLYNGDGVFDSVSTVSGLSDSFNRPDMTNGLGVADSGHVWNYNP